MAGCRPSSTKIPAGGRGEGAGRRLGGIEIMPFLPNLRPEAPHGLDLERIGGGGGKHCGVDAVRPSHVGNALAEIASRRANHARPGIRARAMQQIAGAAALERADGSQRFDLERNLPPKCAIDRLATYDRRVQEGRIDQAGRLLDLMWTAREWP